MGIKDLGRVVSKHAPSAVTPLSSLSDLRGRRVAIDANLLTQVLLYAMTCAFCRAHLSLLFPNAVTENPFRDI